MLIPSFANCVDFSEYNSSNVNTKLASKPALDAIQLPTINKHKPRSLPAIPKKITHLYNTSRRDTVTDNQTRILAYRIPQTHFPTVNL